MRIALALVLVVSFQTVRADDLGDALTPIIQAHRGRVAVSIKNLATGQSWSHRGGEVLQTASLIKVAVMIEAYRQADAKTLDLAKTVTLNRDDKVPGSGILTAHFSDGASFPIRDAVRLMMVYSDNTATNLVLDQVGIKNVNATMAKLGFPETRINAKVFKGSTTSVDPARTKKYSLGSTTADDMVALLEAIHAGKAATPESCKAMIGHMKACTDKDMVTRFVPGGTVVAQKGGATNQVRTNAAILYVPAAGDKSKTVPVAVCVLTNENEDQRWVVDNAGQLTIAKIGKAVFDHFTKN